MENNIQLRGRCQCCGNLQAVVNGRSSKHGYTVDHGWFNGVCSGQHHAPIEQDRKVADDIVETVLADVKVIREKAYALRIGKIDPVWTKWVWVEGKNHKQQQAVECKADELSEYERAGQRKNAIYRHEQRARDGEDFAKYLRDVADKYHGKDLVKVEKKAPAKWIEAGEKKLSEGGHTLIARYQDGARVYYKFSRAGQDKVYTGWIGTQAWRKLPDVE
jgi:hypothetical protein